MNPEGMEQKQRGRCLKMLLVLSEAHGAGMLGAWALLPAHGAAAPGRVSAPASWWVGAPGLAPRERPAETPPKAQRNWKQVGKSVLLSNLLQHARVLGSRQKHCQYFQHYYQYHLKSIPDVQGTLQTKIIDGPRPEAEIAQDPGTGSNGQGLQRDGEEEWTAHGRWLAAPIATFQFALDPVPAEAMGIFFSSFS